MASNVHIQKPYVLTVLPKLLDPVSGRYVVGDVYGTSEGSRRRKRHEVTIGIDGQAVNIYDISSARLITSYPIPPHSTFSCPPTSTRRKSLQSKNAVRYTYAATRDPSQRILLFKDQAETTEGSMSSNKSVLLKSTNPLVYLTTSSARESPAGVHINSASNELIAVLENGSIMIFDGESLETRWKSSPTLLCQDLGIGSQDFTVDFCTAASSFDVEKGIFRGSKDLFSTSTNDASCAADQDLLVMISSTQAGDIRVRHLHIFARASYAQFSSSSTAANGFSQLHVVPLPQIQGEAATRTTYRMDVRSGTLMALQAGRFATYDLTESIPKLGPVMQIDDAKSFLRLTKTSVLVSTSSSVDIYNSQFQARQSYAPLDASILAQLSDSSGAGDTCSLVGYFSRLELAVAISGSNLVAVQLEASKATNNKRKAGGLLIDSIGRGIRQSQRHEKQSTTRVPTKSLFSNYLPGSIRDGYLESFAEESQKTDGLFESGQFHEFEKFLAKKYGVKLNASKITNEVQQNGNDFDRSSTLIEWEWPESRSDYPRVDRRWVIYGIRKVFRWQSEHIKDNAVPCLVCDLPNSNLLTYLVDAGHLTTSNIKSALREQLQDVDDAASVIGEELVARIAALDPTMELVACYISATTLTSVELLIAVRAIMRSLELIQDPKKPAPKLLKQSISEEVEIGDDIEMDLDKLEQEIQRTELYLNANSGVHGSGLSAAFAKLGACSAISTIKTLRTTFKPEEILSLVYLLRAELVKGSWTSRYLDSTGLEQETEGEAPPDAIINLIADLLGRCVDALGSGGWLLNDALRMDDDESTDFIASLKLEVSAALEGLEEAVYLRGIVGEAVKYCQGVQKVAVKEANREARRDEKIDVTKPVMIPIKEPGAEALPLGLKVKAGVELEKVSGAGGEVKLRSGREIGHLLSQQVGPYSLERITI